MQRTVVVIAVVVLLVGFMGFIVLPWLQQKLFGDSNTVTLQVFTACIDDDVAVGTGTTTQTVSRIVAEVEITFKFGSEPDNISDLTIKDDDNNPVDVYWGSREPEKKPNESKGKTALIIREVFFPTDFKQGKLLDKNGKYLCYIRLPPVTSKCERK